MGKAILILAILFLAVGASCSNATEPATQPAPTPKPESQRLKRTEAEIEFQKDSDASGEIQTQATEAAIAFAKANYPGWAILGTSTQGYQGNVYWVDVDIDNKQAKKRAIVSLNVQKFFPESGEPFWEVEPLNDANQRRQSNSEPLIK